MTIQSRFWVDSGDMYLISRAQAVLTRSPKKWWGADLPALTDSNRPPPTAFQIFYSQGAGIGRAHIILTRFQRRSTPTRPIIVCAACWRTALLYAAHGAPSRESRPCRAFADHGA